LVYRPVLPGREGVDVASRESQTPDPAVVAELIVTSRELIQQASATVRRARQVREHRQPDDDHESADPTATQDHRYSGRQEGDI
jgi:hypothetical protein